MTERLYYDDPALLEFEASVVERRRVAQGAVDIVLDRTAFYPTSGGQPHDTGTLGGARVLDVLVEDGDTIVHRLDREPQSDRIEGDRVKGVIDRDRRQDHREHHTGQHILSRAFLDVVGAPTIGFHLGASDVDIDLDAPSISDHDLEAAEALANEIVRANRPVRIGYARSDEDRALLSLRDEPAIEGVLRIIEVEGFDATACGGTHCLATGEIGVIKLRRWEKAGSRFRVHFLCGGRALADYGRKNRLVVDLAKRLSVEEAEVEPAVLRSLSEGSSLRKEVRALREELARRDASALLAGAEVVGGVRVVIAPCESSNAETLAQLAGALGRGSTTLAGLASIDGNLVRVLLVRTQDLSTDLRPVLPAILRAIEGRGGGRAESVQGAGPRLEGFAEALSLARSALLAAAPDSRSGSTR